MCQCPQCPCITGAHIPKDENPGSIVRDFCGNRWWEWLFGGGGGGSGGGGEGGGPGGGGGGGGGGDMGNRHQLKEISFEINSYLFPSHGDRNHSQILTTDGCLTLQVPFISARL